MDLIKIERAKQFASEKFTGAGIKNHFLDVFNILCGEFGVEDEDVLIAGILHDTLEDTSTTSKEIEKEFSKKAATLVDEVSHPKNYNQEQREAFYQHIKTISRKAKLIKAADFASHLRTFIKIYERGDQHLYPKFANNDKYVRQIREFTEGVSDPKISKLVTDLTYKLEALL